jgi:hypothetical protein
MRWHVLLFRALLVLGALASLVLAAGAGDKWT